MQAEQDDEFHAWAEDKAKAVESHTADLCNVSFAESRIEAEGDGST